MYFLNAYKMLPFLDIRVKMFTLVVGPRSPMSAIAQASRTASLNRRSRVRQKVHAPAYASFRGAPRNEMLDLCEVLDISEAGVAVQCAAPMKENQQVELCLDLAEAREQISATARVVWSDSTGRVGLALAPLENSALHCLREWLFLNAMAGAANAAALAPLRNATPPQPAVPVHAENETLAAAAALQREAESLGSDLEAVLSLIASRSRFLLLASGAAIALTGKESGAISGTMICRASTGRCAPPVGATLQVGSGFSGECIRTGAISRCDDAESDSRVDRESCRALGIRSMLAAPIGSGENVIGILEVFCIQPNAFGEDDSAVLQLFAETIFAAVNRAALVSDPFVPPASTKPFAPTPGSVLFADEPEKKVKLGAFHLPLFHLYLLICAASAIALALGFMLAPRIQARLQARDRSGEQTVLASSQPPQPATAAPAIETATLAQLQQLAQKGDPAAQNALGLRYASGNGVSQDDSEAARWFTKAAENGNVKAQALLGTRYWAGRGVPTSLNQAYFWTILARAAGDKNSKTFAEFLASRMTRAQAAAIEQQANIWYQQHQSRAKPSPAR